MIIKRSRSLLVEMHDWYIDKDGERKTKNPNSYPNCFTVRPSLNCYMPGNLHSLANLYSLQAAEDGGHASKQKADVYAKRASELQKKILDSLWHYPAPDDAFVFYKKRGSIDDPFSILALPGTTCTREVLSIS